MHMQVEWSVFKSVCTSRSLSMQYIDLTGSYALMAFDQRFEICCTLVEPADITEFEATYKALGNKPIVSLNSTFTAKTVGTKALFARNTGVQFAVSVGANDLLYTIAYPWIKIVGMECVNGEALDTCDLWVLDSTSGSYTGVPNYPLNQFGINLNMAAGYYSKTSTYDADLYIGMQLKLVYNSLSAKTIGVNIIQNEVK